MRSSMMFMALLMASMGSTPPVAPMVADDERKRRDLPPQGNSRTPAQPVRTVFQRGKGFK